MHCSSGEVSNDYQDVQSEMWMADVHCAGREDFIDECVQSGWDKQNCSDNDVATVKCQGKCFN